MNIVLLVLRLVPGLLFVGHGLQKLVPPRLSPRLLAAHGPRAVGAGFEQMGLRPGFALALLAGASEAGGGLLIASGFVTPLGTALLAAVMTVAILTVHVQHGIWNTAGGFEFPLLMLTTVYVVSALGPGTFSIDHWVGIGNWTGVHWDAQNAARAGAAVGIGVAAGLITMVAGRVEEAMRHERHRVFTAH